MLSRSSVPGEMFINKSLAVAVLSLGQHIDNSDRFPIPQKAIALALRIFLFPIDKLTNL